MLLRSTTNDENARLTYFWAIERAFSRELAKDLIHPSVGVYGRPARTHPGPAAP